MRKVHVVLTQDDIDHGSRGSCSYCPQARAIKRALEGRPFTYVCVSRSSITVGEEDGSLYLGAEAPLSVSTFVTRFDYGLPVEPMEYTLTLERRY